MLNENQIKYIPEVIAGRINAINNEYLEEIGGVLKKIGELRPKDVHRLQQMYNYGADMDRVINKLEQVSGKNVQDIYDAFDIVAKENYDFARPFYEARNIKFIPYEKNKDLQGYVKSIAKQTVGEYVNLTQHTAFAVFDKGGKNIAPLFAANKDKVATSLSDTYTKLVDYAVTKVQLGEESYQKAVKDICKAMVNSGIKTVDYATGYSRSLESAVRQNVLWGVKECNQNTADRIGEEFGADGYEISYHSNPRESHADMAGKQFAIGKARTVNGVLYPSFEEVAEPLLQEFNCLHFKFPIILGVSAPAYSEEQLEAFKAEDNKTFKFEGKTYTKYEASQVQNALERKMVAQKELANMAKGAGDDDLRREAQGNINLLASKYNDFCKASGLPTRAERMNVSGFKPTKTEKSRIAFNSKPGGSSGATVDISFVNSQKYADKFKGLTKDEKINEIIAEKSRTILRNRNGTLYEELYAIDARTGRVLTYKKGKDVKSIQMTSKLKKLLTTSQEKSIIIVHNHPDSSTLSAKDVITMLDYKSISHTIAAGHDGSIFSISNLPRNKNIIRDFRLSYTKYREKWSPHSSGDKAWREVARKWGFTYERK